MVHDFNIILEDPEVTVICETMGGVEPAYTFSKKAILAGKSVCTSNKELVANHGSELIRLAKENHCNYLFEASVGGGIPIIRPLNYSLTAEKLDAITGILNGTTNYILTKMDEDGADFADVLKEAQEKGYAERKPEADVEGYDACRKIAILSSLMKGETVNYEKIYTEGITKITADDFVLEIGPGIGTMTQYLAEAAGRVVAVEIDRELIPILEETLSPYNNVTVMCADILKVDLAALVRENGGRPIKVVANLPYYITTPIIMALFESRVPLASITVMVQSEVADRMQTGPGSKDYGALSLAVQYYAKPEIVTKVPAGCFMPKPNVDSAVIRLTRYEKPPVEVEDETWLFAVIRASFNQRRKTLANGLANAGYPGIGRRQVEEVLSAMGLAAAVRGETLTLEQFAELSDRLAKRSGQSG